jgi:predicted lipoprotein with Yx(FWY)xxD motif
MMVKRNKALTRIGSMVAVLGAALLVTACGSSSSSSSAPAATATPASSGSTGSAKAISITTAKGADGTYLVGPSGRPIYLWVADSGGKSACAGACAQVWPPVIASATPTVSGGVNAANLGTITRSDGAKQVTYMGHPLYYFIEDKGTNIKGQGSNSFGAKWWLVAPSGSAITTSGSAATASSSGSSSNSGSSSGGTTSSGSSSGGGWG